MKVTPYKYARLIELKLKYNLTHAIIAERLGLSVSSVKVYLREARKKGDLPSHPGGVPSTPSAS